MPLYQGGQGEALNTVEHHAYPKHTSTSRVGALSCPKSTRVPERSTPPHALAMGRARHGEASIVGARTGGGRMECTVYFALTRDASRDM
jgi:hypothetical protein